ncbi:MAG: acyltransferase domain-containing protein [Elusimicrobiota bacterium]|nr:MAG: acyltransferase domain-containing protein [Elusimicrobiota bacterium]
MSEKVCALFAGQSVQEAGMGKELLKIPAAKAVIDRLKPSLGADLETLLTTMPDPELALTFNAQRAIHASHLGHWFAYLAKNPGTELNGAVGHSMGVVAALVAAEALTVEDSGRFIAARAKAFSDCCKGFSEPMGLAAAASDDFQDVADSASEVPGVSVALWNTITKGTLGGTAAALEAYAAKAVAEDWPVKVKVLKVEGPYHTAAFAPAKLALQEVVKSLDLKAPKVPVFMGTSGKAETDPARIKELLAEQTVACEKHLEAVRAAHAAGCRTFVEASFKPQPVTWLGDQLEAGSYAGIAVPTAELA